MSDSVNVPMYAFTVSRRYTGQMRWLASPDTMHPSKSLQQRVEIVEMSPNGLIPSNMSYEWEDVPTVDYWDTQP